MDSVERLVREWLRGMCSCRSISDSQHDLDCVRGNVNEYDIEELVRSIYDWHDDVIDNEIAEELENVMNPEAAGLVVIPHDDPE